MNKDFVMSQQRQRAAFEYLLRQFHASTAEPPGQRWRYLEAAHVLGHNRIDLHWRAHWQMWGYARALGDKQEARGQIGHLAMVPVGHLVRRVPQGNTGRAIVPAMQNMMPSHAVRACMTAALQAIEPQPKSGG